MTRKKSFTLIELVITVMLIGVLAAVAVPISRSMDKQAIEAEAIATSNNIRVAIAAYAAEFPNPSQWFNLDDGSGVWDGGNGDLQAYLGLNVGGTYFGPECYGVTWNSASLNWRTANIRIYCLIGVGTSFSGRRNSAPKASTLESWQGPHGGHDGTMMMDMSGTITRSGSMQCQ